MCRIMPHIVIRSWDEGVRSRPFKGQRRRKGEMGNSACTTHMFICRCAKRTGMQMRVAGVRTLYVEGQWRREGATYEIKAEVVKTAPFGRESVRQCSLGSLRPCGRYLGIELNVGLTDRYIIRSSGLMSFDALHSSVMRACAGCQEDEQSYQRNRRQINSQYKRSARATPLVPDVENHGVSRGINFEGSFSEDRQPDGFRTSGCSRKLFLRHQSNWHFSSGLKTPGVMLHL